jgi:hypothetical protein
MSKEYEVGKKHRSNSIGDKGGDIFDDTAVRRATFAEPGK